MSLLPLRELKRAKVAAGVRREREATKAEPEIKGHWPTFQTRFLWF